MNEDWWNVNLPNHMPLFRKWLGDYDRDSSNLVREHARDIGATSFLDCGCGLGVEFHGFQHAGYAIRYLGIDTCDALLQECHATGVPAIKANIERQPFSNRSFDVVYCRHVLEHLPTYKNAVSEMLRLPVKELIVVFFVPPREKHEIVQVTPAGFSPFVYRNTYARTEIEAFLYAHPQCRKVQWIEVKQESILKVEMA